MSQREKEIAENVRRLEANMYNIRTSSEYDKIKQEHSFNNAVNRYGVGGERQNLPDIFKMKRNSGDGVDEISKFYREYKQGLRDI